jgi:hypothetical protein
MAASNYSFITSFSGNLDVMTLRISFTVTFCLTSLWPRDLFLCGNNVYLTLLPQWLGTFPLAYLSTLTLIFGDTFSPFL